MERRHRRRRGETITTAMYEHGPSSGSDSPGGPHIPLLPTATATSSSSSSSWKALMILLVIELANQSPPNYASAFYSRSIGILRPKEGCRIHSRCHRKHMFPSTFRTIFRSSTTATTLRDNTNYKKDDKRVNRIRLFNDLTEVVEGEREHIDEFLDEIDDNVTRASSSTTSSISTSTGDAVVTKVHLHHNATMTTTDDNEENNDEQSSTSDDGLDVSSSLSSVSPVSQHEDQFVQGTKVSPSNSSPIGSDDKHLTSFVTADFSSSKDNNDTKGAETSSISTTSAAQAPKSVVIAPICRIVTRAGSRLPSDPTTLPPYLYEKPYLLDKLDAYYHAKSRQITQELFLNNNIAAAISKKTKKSGVADKNPRKKRSVWMFNSTDGDISGGSSSGIDDSQDGDKKVVSCLRSSLEDSGFELMSRRDLDLCEALNAGYLLRLSIIPDVSELDPGLYDEFYPERVYTASIDSNTNTDRLFDGRILVYWRGYSQEVSTGRLLLPKIDYLQASLVQRSAAWVKSKLDKVEMEIWRSFMSQSRMMRMLIRRLTTKFIRSIKVKQLARFIQASLTDSDDNSMISSAADDDENNENLLTSRGTSFKLSRYGGSKIKFVGSPNPNDALDPFIICETGYGYDTTSASTEPKRFMTNGTLSSEAILKPPNYNGPAYSSIIEHDMYEEVNHNQYTCEYDARVVKEEKRRDPKLGGRKLPKMRLLERVSISNLVDIFTKSGRRGLLNALFSKSTLVEPTFEEVIVIWRPLPKQDKVVVTTPRLVSELADMFDVEGFDQPREKVLEISRGNIEIRNFEQVPMSNLPAVLPKTKLIFRPADAFLFDLISLFTFALVVSSVRFDSSRLDFLALVSVVLWVFRTVFRYSNKLARYDLLVKTFLTSKISQRNGGALKYLSYEAGAQRAIRAALVHAWALYAYENTYSLFRTHQDERKVLTRSYLEENCVDEVNKLLLTDEEVQLNPSRAIQDLVDLRLLRLADDGETVLRVNDINSSTTELKALWMDLLDDRYSQVGGSTSFRFIDERGDFYEGVNISEDMDLQDYAENRSQGPRQFLTAPDGWNGFLETTMRNLKRLRYWKERGKAVFSDSRDFIREKRQSIKAVKEAIRRFDSIEPKEDSRSPESLSGDSTRGS